MLMRPAITLALLVALASSPALGRLSEEGWIELTGPKPLEAWKSPTGVWVEVGAVQLDSKNPKRLAADPGAGVIYNGPLGRSTNLVTKQSFGDVELHVEFLLPKGSNSGVKMEGVYEIQMLDSWGVKTPKATDNGGIYPRAELLPKYHYLDEGYPPLANASKPPGEWQTLDIIFHTPRFDGDGKKTADARFVKVVLNGQVIHENAAVPSPTGHNWKNTEKPSGPILLQADHGPVAFRNVRARPIDKEK
jgi:Domain of Unknown Function (DUF1080)